LAADVAKAEALLDHGAPWWRTLNDARQDVMVNLCFNMGWGDGKHGLSSFWHTLEAVRLGLYSAAAEGLLASKWAKQVHGRANRLAEQLRTGERAPGSVG
jgi:lysozyme